MYGVDLCSSSLQQIAQFFVCLQTWKHDLSLIFGHRPAEARLEHIVVCFPLPGFPVVDASLTGLGVGVLVRSCSLGILMFVP
jgi:hypothetical protein